jgi:hypothetical protein
MILGESLMRMEYPRFFTPRCLPALSVFAALMVGTFAFAQQSHVGKPDSELITRFGDPFFQFTSAVADCPAPLGPVLSVQPNAAQARLLAEELGAYAHDAEIASKLKAALLVNQLYTHSPLVNSSLWATVQGRIVTIEGCMAGDAYTSFDHGMITTQIENVAKAIPNVVRAVVLVRTSGQTRAGSPVPYRLRP